MTNEKLVAKISIDETRLPGMKNFMKGKIQGFIEAICVTYSEKRYKIEQKEDRVIFRGEATPEEFVELKKRLGFTYPKLWNDRIITIEAIKVN